MTVRLIAGREFFGFDEHLDAARDVGLPFNQVLAFEEPSGGPRGRDLEVALHIGLGGGRGNMRV